MMGAAGRLAQGMARVNEDNDSIIQGVSNYPQICYDLLRIGLGICFETFLLCGVSETNVS